jgi:hypothetical protein
MADELSVADRALLGHLAAVLDQVRPVPRDAVWSARGLFAWRTVDAELADMAYDSLLDDDTALARSTGGPRIVTFEAGELTLEVEVDARPGGRRLVGQLVPAQPAALELRQPTLDPSGSIATTADEFGRFTLPMPAEATVVRVRVTTADGRVVESAAVRL